MVFFKPGVPSSRIFMVAGMPRFFLRASIVPLPSLVHKPEVGKEKPVALPHNS
jgi:hypothetical protein